LNEWSVCNNNTRCLYLNNCFDNPCLSLDSCDELYCYSDGYFMLSDNCIFKFGSFECVNLLDL
jgi:hypothetical protein